MYIIVHYVIRHWCLIDFIYSSSIDISETVGVCIVVNPSYGFGVYSSDHLEKLLVLHLEKYIGHMTEVFFSLFITTTKKITSYGKWVLFVYIPPL